MTYTKRQFRRYQAKRRGGSSYIDKYERAVIVLLLETGDLSEGQAAKVLGLDRVSLRELRLNLIDDGWKVAIDENIQRTPL